MSYRRSEESENRLASAAGNDDDVGMDCPAIRDGNEVTSYPSALLAEPEGTTWHQNWPILRTEPFYLRSVSGRTVSDTGAGCNGDHRPGTQCFAERSASESGLGLVAAAEEYGSVSVGEPTAGDGALHAGDASDQSDESAPGTQVGGNQAQTPEAKRRED